MGAAPYRYVSSPRHIGLTRAYQQYFERGLPTVAELPTQSRASTVPVLATQQRPAIITREHTSRRCIMAGEMQ